MIKKLILVLTKPLRWGFNKTIELLWSGMLDYWIGLHEKEYKKVAKGVLKIYLGGLLVALAPIWALWGIVFGGFILIHFGWVAAVAYIMCHYTGSCPF